MLPKKKTERERKRKRLIYDGPIRQGGGGGFRFVVRKRTVLKKKNLWGTVFDLTGISALLDARL